MLILSGHRSRLRCLAFSPDGQFLASAAGSGHAVSLWDALRGQRLGYLTAGSDRASALAFAPAAPAPGQPGPHPVRLASLNVYSGLHLWDVAERRLIASLRSPQGAGAALAFSPDGAVLIAAAIDSGRYTLDAWDVARGLRSMHARGPSGTIWSLAFSPDGRTLAVGGDRTIDLWPVSLDPPTRRIPSPFPVRALAYSPDGLSLAAASRQLLTIHDLEAGTMRLQYRAHEGVVNGLMYSPDGRTLASGSGDGLVCLWDPLTGARRAAFDWDIGEIRAVAFAPDAMRAAAGGTPNIVVWDLDE